MQGDQVCSELGSLSSLLNGSTDSFLPDWRL